MKFNYHSELLLLGVKHVLIVINDHSPPQILAFSFNQGLFFEFWPMVFTPRGTIINLEDPLPDEVETLKVLCLFWVLLHSSKLCEI